MALRGAVSAGRRAQLRRQDRRDHRLLGLERRRAGLATDGTFITVTPEACKLRDQDRRDAACWGNDSVEKASPPAGAFITVTAGLLDNCGPRMDGTRPAGAATSSGSSRRRPHVHRRERRTFHSCAIKTDGTSGRWGHDGSGQATPLTAPSPRSAR